MKASDVRYLFDYDRWATMHVPRAAVGIDMIEFAEARQAGTA